MKYKLILFAMAFFCSCISPKRLYINEVDQFKKEVNPSRSVFTNDDFAHLPVPVKRFFDVCGFIGKPKYEYVEIVWNSSEIMMRPNQRWLRLKTFQHNFVTEPSRLAYMRANMLGFIPFEGRDKYHNGNGHMYGLLGKIIKIFDAKDPEIAQGAAIVVLSESLLIPSFAIQPYIQWESVDDFTAKARFVHKGVDVGGTFHFNELGEYIRFTTNERPYSLPKGGYEIQPYTIEIRSYQPQGDTKVAREVSAIWNLPEGDFEYWRGVIKEFKYY